MISIGKNSVDLNQDILSKVSEFDILAFYLGIYEIPTIIHSPLRKDTHTSFGLYSKDGNRVFYRDLKTKEQGGIFDMLGQMWSMSYDEVLAKIANEVQYMTASDYKPKFMYGDSQKSVCSNTTELKCKVREWKSWDIEFWESFGIPLSMLKFGDIYPISHIILINENGVRNIPAEKYAYAYVERKDGNVTLKIYQPFSEKYKWVNKHDSSVWDLWTKLPNNGNHLIITSSRKDALNLWYNTSIPSISLQGEGYLPKPHIIDELKSRFKKIYVFFDNDFSKPENPGRTNSLELCNKYDLIHIEIPDEYEAKDPSDLYKKYGKDTYTNILKKIIV